MADLKDALDRATAEGARNARLWRWFQVSHMVWAWSWMLFAASIGVGLILASWITGYWTSFFDTTLPLLVSLSIVTWPVRTLVERNRARRQEERLAVLRDIALAADDELAPPYDPQPEALAPGAEPTGATRFGPFREVQAHPARDLLWGCLGAVAMAATLVVFGVLCAVIPAGGNPMLAVAPGLYWDVLAASEFAAAIYLVGVGVVLGMRARRRRGNLWLIASEWGVRAARDYAANDEDSIAWHEVRAFYSIPISTGRWDPLFVRVYALDTETRIIAWVASVGDQRSKERHERLCSLVAARTELPLRDLKVADRVIPNPPLNRVPKLHPEAAASVSNRTRGIPFVSYSPVWTRGVVASLVVPMLVCVPLFAAPWIGPRLEPYRFDPLVARIHAETPLFHNALTRDDGLLPVHAASANDPGTYRYAGAGYQLAADRDTFLFALLDQPYGDAAVEVTVSLSGVGASSGSIGLWLHVSDVGAGSVSFRIDQDGGWTAFGDAGVGRTDVYASGSNTLVIHRGADTTNRLLVVMHGAECLCFVNDQFVGAVYDSRVSAGQIGLILAGGNIVGRFSNLTIYPVPSF